MRSAVEERSGYQAAEYLADVRRITELLIEDAKGRHPAGHVIRVVARCRQELAGKRELRVTPEAIEERARHRLSL